MDSPQQSFKSYAQWRKSVGRAFRNCRPDVEIADLDKNFLWESFSKGVAPEDFVVQTDLRFEVRGRDNPPSAPEATQAEAVAAPIESPPPGDHPCPHCRQMAVTETMKEEASQARTAMQGLAGICLIIGALLIMGGCFGLWIVMLALAFLAASFVLTGLQACFPHSVVLTAIRTCHACGRTWRVEDGQDQPVQVVSDAEFPDQVGTRVWQ